MTLCRIVTTACALSSLVIAGIGTLVAGDAPATPKGALHDLEFYPGMRQTPNFDWEVVDRTGKGDRLMWTPMPALKESGTKLKLIFTNQPFHCSPLAGCRLI